MVAITAVQVYDKIKPNQVAMRIEKIHLRIFRR